MSETKLSQTEVHERAESIDEDIKQEMYDNATNIGGIKNMGIRDFVSKEVNYYKNHLDEPEAVLRQAAANAASEAASMMAEEGKFMD